MKKNIHLLKKINSLIWRQSGENAKKLYFWVPMVLHPHGIAPTFLKLDSWSPGAGFIPIITTNVLNKIKKEKF